MLVSGMYFQRYHFLMCLMLIEMSVICLYSGVLIGFGEGLITEGRARVLLFFGISVCDCLVGLGLLILSRGSKGSDKVRSLFSLA